MAGIPFGTNISPYWGNGFLWSAVQKTMTCHDA
jgi:hypothetical protein